jgi:hypothetical protein
MAKLLVLMELDFKKDYKLSEYEDVNSGPLYSIYITSSDHRLLFVHQRLLTLSGFQNFPFCANQRLLVMKPVPIPKGSLSLPTTDAIATP